MRTRAARPDDDAAIDAVIGAAFGEEGPVIVRLLGLLAAAGHRRASLVAEQDGALVGHVQLSRSWVDARERLVEVLVLSPLSVLPEAQGRGVGTALVAAAPSGRRRSTRPPSSSKARPTTTAGAVSCAR